MTAGYDKSRNLSAGDAVRAVDFDEVAGRAEQTGVDANGNPVYKITAASVRHAGETILVEGVSPDRVADGVLVVQSHNPARARGIKSPFVPGGWIWTVYGEHIDWGDCEP